MQLWMVRAGEGSTLAEAFEQSGYVAIGWMQAGDLSALTTRAAIRERIEHAFPDDTPTAIAQSTGQTHRFRNVIQPNDRVVTYDGPRREYLIGTVVGDYEYRPNAIEGMNHIRRVEWSGRVPKAALRRSSINSLGAIMTLFDPGDSVLTDIEDALRTGRQQAADSEDYADDEPALEDLRSLFQEFETDYLATDTAKANRALYEPGRAAGKSNFDDIGDRLARGEDVTDQILRKLLPHTNTRSHRDQGDWIHIAPAITKDIRSWYEGAGWAKADDWPSKAKLIWDLVETVTRKPETLAEACATFASSPYAKGLQGGMLTPILNALRPDTFAIVNNKVCKLLEAVTGVPYRPTIATYPDTNAVVFDLVDRNNDLFSQAEAAGIKPIDAFDMMAHWYVAVREADTDEDEANSLPRRLRRSDLDRASASHARQVIERLCPDPAPRAVVLDQLVRSIQYAHSQSPSNWSVTLKPNVVRLNVGGIVAIDLRAGGLFTVVHEPALSPDARRVVDAYEHGREFRWIEGAAGFLFPFADLDPAVTLVRTAHEAVIRLVAEKSQYAVFRNAHSPGVLAFLRTLNSAVPDPSYSGDRKKDDDEDATPGVRGGHTRVDKHDVYSIDEFATETHIDPPILEGWIRSINRKGQAILYGPPGTGKTFIAERICRHLLSGGDGHSDIVQFHPAYTYEDFIQGLRPQIMKGGALSYELVAGRFMEFCKIASERSGVSVLLIDEINRANLAQVFGELMYLLEYRDKELPLAGGRRLRIPPNVRVVGTMNTADRSIALVDHALRRRFSFIPLDPNYDVLRRFHELRGRDVDGLIGVLQELNVAINDRHYGVGISFFMRDTLLDDIEAIWKGEIEPYIHELFFDRSAESDRFSWTKVGPRLQGN